jgi:phenylacetate-CoA ligase
MKDFRSTVLATSPSFALHIGETMEHLGSGSQTIFLRIGLFGPEAMPPRVRQDLEERLKIHAYAIYGVNEMVEPGVAGECPQKVGLHLAEDHFYPEIIDPHSGRLLPPGEEGELVITTLTNEGYPLVRFRTGDVSRLDYSTCDCGRTSARMSPPLRRSDDLLVVRGIAMYPDHITHLLAEVAPNVRNHRLIIRKRHGLNDQLELQVALPDDYVSDWYGTQRLADTIRSHLRRAIGMGIKVKLVEAGSLAGEEREIVFEE